MTARRHPAAHCGRPPDPAVISRPAIDHSAIPQDLAASRPREPAGPLRRKL